MKRLLIILALVSVTITVTACGTRYACPNDNGDGYVPDCYITTDDTFERFLESAVSGINKYNEHQERLKNGM